MKIGIDARFYGSIGKGLGRYTEKLIEYLERVDSENDYVVFLLPENFDEYIPKNVRFQKVLSRYPWYGFSEQFFFPFQLLSYHFDLMHFPHFNVPILYWKKFVVTIHDLILLHYPTAENTTRSRFFYAMKFIAYRFVIACAVYRSHHIITVSAFTKEDIIATYPSTQKKISVTYEATDEWCQFLLREQELKLFRTFDLLKSDVSEEPLSKQVKSYVLYVGNAYPHKNLDIFLELSPRFPEQLFVLVGKEDFFYKRLKKRVQDRRIQNILFLGFVDDWQLNTLYRFASCYFFPSLYEGFGLPPLEAMARGIPVLSSSRGSLPEILGNAALYFDPDRVDDGEKKLTEILISDTLRMKCIRLGYAHIRQYSFDRMARETRDVYERSIKNKQ
ncbi:MAG: glycosyltransferase family 1 protein [Candidatus Moranbacteria bacterium]|nr:glycosyltransferase family 1 protein [Candidatus Moranbacteria bacterium]MDD3964804.1 glycosyltransferase family 1 protein [Candidatus Moranbacteria bacterium]